MYTITNRSVVMTENKRDMTYPELVENIIRVSDGNLFYGQNHALQNISIEIKEKSVTALIGPSGCGKSTFLRCLNRMNDLIDGCVVKGNFHIGQMNVYDVATDVVDLRKKVGMVFQKPNPFPMSIYDNIAYGPRIHGVTNKKDLDKIVEKSLRQASLWEEVKDRLHESGLGLSGGQQQRLVIARVLAVEPNVILMDEPASALDPISTGNLEDLIQELKKDFTIVIVTHNMQQAARVSDYTAFFLNGELIEYDSTDKIFTNPGDSRTEDYITGRFG